MEDLTFIEKSLHTADILDAAIIVATRAHAGMTRKGSKTPYILHPLEAAAIVATMTDDRNIIAAAVLHDVVEDTNISPEEIERIFGGKIKELVAAESEDKRSNLDPKETWKIRKQETIEHLKSASIDVKMVTLGDKLSNIRAISRDYEAIGEQLWDRFNQKDKKEHGWYYKAILDALADELSGFPAWREYDFLVKSVFQDL